MLDKLYNKKVTLVDVFDRSIAKTEPCNESPLDHYFSRLSNSVTDRAEAERSLIERLLAFYPPDNRASLIRRMRRSNSEFFAVFTEIFVNYYLKQAQYSLLDIESELSDVPTKPDFVFKSPHGAELYVEATSTFSLSEIQQKNRLVLKALEQYMRNIQIGPFQVMVTWKGDDQVILDFDSARQRLFDELIPNIRAKRLSKFSFSFTKSTHIKVQVTRARLGRATQWYFGTERVYSNSHKHLRDALSGKASRYGKLGKPFLVVVNSLADHIDEVDFQDAVVGPPVVAFSGDVRQPFISFQDIHKSALKPAKDAVDDWRREQLSAVLFFKQLTPRSVIYEGIRGELYTNPFATIPWFEELPGATHCMVSNQGLVSKTKSAISISPACSFFDQEPYDA